MTQKEEALLLLTHIMENAILHDNGNGVVTFVTAPIRLGDTSIVKIKDSLEMIKIATQEYQTIEEWANSFIGKEMREGGSKVRNYVGQGIIEDWELGVKGTGIHFKFRDVDGEIHSVWRPLPRKFLEK